MTKQNNTQNKSILRVQKDKNNPYVMMNKTFLEDPRLSFKAKGILAYVLSKPDNWQVRVSDLVKRSDDGETAVYSGLNELKQYGYLQKYPVRINGKIHHWESVVYEIPNTPENPLLENHDVVVKSQLCKKDIPEKLFLENQNLENQNLENQNLENPERNNNVFNNNVLMEINVKRASNQSVSPAASGALCQTTDRPTEKKVSQIKFQEKPELQLPVCEITEADIKRQIGYSSLAPLGNTDLLDEIVLNMFDMYHSSEVKIKNDVKPQCIVHSVLNKVTYWHIVYILERFDQVTTTIKNKKGYLQTMIYNSVLEKQAHYTNEIKVDYLALAQESRASQEQEAELADEELEKFYVDLS